CLGRAGLRRDRRRALCHRRLVGPNSRALRHPAAAHARGRARPTGGATRMKSASKPFDFYTVAALTCVGNQVAGTIAELHAGLQNCSDASIFHHTFQTLGSHHFLTEGFSNDFAQWVLTSTNRSDLAEQLGALDVRDYLSIAELRADLKRMVGDYC